MTITKGLEKAVASNESLKSEDAYGDDANDELTPDEPTEEEATANAIVSADETTEKGDTKEDVKSDGVTEAMPVVCGGEISDEGMAKAIKGDGNEEATKIAGVQMGDGDKDDIRNGGNVETAENASIFEGEKMEEEGNKEEEYGNKEKLKVDKQLVKASNKKAKQMPKKRKNKKAAAATPVANSNSGTSNYVEPVVSGGASDTKDVDKLKFHDNKEDVQGDGDKLSKLKAKRVLKKKNKDVAAAAGNIANASIDADRTGAATVDGGGTSCFKDAENVKNVVASAGDILCSKDAVNTAKGEVKSDGVAEATNVVVSGGQIADEGDARDVKVDGNVEETKTSFNYGFEMADREDKEDMENDGNTEAVGKAVNFEGVKLEEEGKKGEGCGKIEKLKDGTQLQKVSNKKGKQVAKKKNKKAAATAVNNNAVVSKDAHKPGTAEMAADGVASSKDADKLKVYDMQEEVQDDGESGKASNLKAKNLLKKKNKKDAAAAARDANKTRSATAAAGDVALHKDAENFITTDAVGGDALCSKDADKIVREVAAASDDACLKDANKPRSSASEKDLKKKDGTGLIFMCSKKTKKDCYKYNILGLPESKKEIVAKVYKGMKLFLYDIDLKLMYGIYKAAGPGGYNIEPKAFKSAFPSQVRFTLLHDCKPLPEEKFKEAIKRNYYRKNKFNCVLSPEQVKNLCKLFQSESKPSKLKRGRGANRAGPVLGSTDHGRKRKHPADSGSEPVYRRRHDLYEREASPLPGGQVPSSTTRGRKRRRHAVSGSDPIYQRRHNSYEREASPMPAGSIRSSTDRGRKRKGPAVGGRDPVYRRRHDLFEREAYPSPPPRPVAHRDTYRSPPRPPVARLYEREAYRSPPQPVARLYEREAYPSPPRTAVHLYEREVNPLVPSQPALHLYERESYPLAPPQPVALSLPRPPPVYTSVRPLEDYYYRQEPGIQLHDPIAYREPVRYQDSRGLYREPGSYPEASYSTSLSSTYPPLYRY